MVVCLLGVFFGNLLTGLGGCTGAEPGFYHDGHFGIRIENLVRVVPAKTEHNFKERNFLTFENLTFVPIQRKLIVADMLTKAEVRAATTLFSLSLSLSLSPFTVALVFSNGPRVSQVDYIDHYHSQCRDKVAPLLTEMNKKDALAWLMRETQPIG